MNLRVLQSQLRESNSKIIFAGNGASASIAAHGATDFTKQGKIRSITFNEANLITCLSNDYGYENWMKEALNFYSNTGDLIVLISVSGESEIPLKQQNMLKMLEIQL